MEKIRFGIIGLGNQGNNYLKRFENNQIENGVITALCDLNPVKVQKVQERTPLENITYFNDYKEMLDSGLVDAVLVETPHYFHPEIAIECLNRDINVIVDKPAGVYTKQVREMNEVAEKSKAKFAVLFNQRMTAVYRKMRELIQAGEIGDIQRVTWIITDWFRTQQYYDSGSWRATWAGEGGGVLINQCPHQIDLLQWVVGKMPVKVNAFCHYGKWHDIEVEDDVTAYFEYDNGATGVFITTTGEAPGTNRFEVSGTKGKLLCEGGKLFLRKNTQDSREFCNDPANTFGGGKLLGEMVEVETDGQNTGHVGIISNFANALLGLEDFFVDGKEGIRGVELMNAIELSGWKGGAPVTIPVNEDEYLEELNKRRATSRLKVVDDSTVADTSGTFGSGNGAKQ